MKVKNKSPFIFKNSVDETHTETIHFDLEQNAIKVISEDTLMFSKPVVITDNSEMWSGAKYDIPTLDISEYKGKLTADHRDLISNVLGTVIGVKKVANRKVTIDGIKLAVKENPLADYAKRMMMAGHLTDFSIETIGPWPDDDGIFKNAKLVGLSLVVTGNNKQAHINDIAKQTMEDAKRNGLDTALFAQALKLPIDSNKKVLDNDLDMFKTIRNTQTFAVTLKYKNAAGNEVEMTLAPNQTIDVSADQETALNEVVKNAVEPKPEPDPKPKDDAAKQTADIAGAVKSAIDTATKPLLDKVDALEKQIFDNAVKEPTFTKAGSQKTISVQTVKDLDNYDHEERAKMQINLAWEFLQDHNQESGRKLITINEYHLEKLKEAKKVKNAMTITDFGNFVISPELLSEIEGFRSNFKNLLAVVNFKETLSTKMAWLSRNGDIDTEEVAFCDDGADGNLKPVKEYDAVYHETSLQELAAVTPVCTAANRFLAVDILGDIAEGYRTDYDRKKSQLFIVRLQQAVNRSGNSLAYIGTTDVTALKAFFGLASEMQQDVMGGYYILSQKSYWALMARQMGAGINTEAGFRIFTTGENGPLMLGVPYVVVPNELLPTWNTNETRSFVVDGVTVTINQAIFFVDVSTFSGRTSGGLNYDFSTQASYEVGGVVKSAWQRNELVVRGSYFRGGEVRNDDKVVGMAAAGLS